MRKKKKIAIFHCGFIYSGGGERIILEEAKGLQNRGYYVEIFVPTLDKKLCYPKQIRKLNVKTFLPQMPESIPFRFAFQMVLSSIFAPFFAYKFRKFDLILGANQPGAWIAYCISKILGKPYIVYLNQPNRLLYPRKIDRQVDWKNLKEYYYINRLIQHVRFFVSRADKMSFTGGKIMLENGDYMGKIIKKVYGKDVVACPAGAYPQSLRSLRVKNKLYTKLKIRNVKGKVFNINNPFILITNRHVPQKKFEYGIKAFKIILKKFPEYKLVIPGSFTLYTLKLLDLCKSLEIENSVIFLEQISEDSLQKLYQEAFVYIYTAPQEDFGMGIIESMAWGVPVVAWNNAGPTTTVESGKTGYLARPYDVSDFAEKIITILKDRDKRNKMGIKAWERVRDNFSWERHLNTLERSMIDCLN